MQRILSNKQSDIGSPYVFYTIEVETSNRSATQVDVQTTIKSHLQYNSSYLSNGSLIGYFEFQDNQNRSINIKSSSDRWSGTTEHIATSRFALNASASQTSISCKFKVDSTVGSGTLNELYTSNITIPIGHNPPLISSYSITETNQDLINAGISNNVFVANLSKKNFNIVYELFDDTTLLRASVYNSTNQNYLSTTLPVLMDLTQNPLYTTEDGVPIYVRITDSLNGATYFTNNGVVSGVINPDFYNYIPYTKVSLTNSNTTAKRLGQISGRVGLTINGNFYNGVVGNVDQTTYKPTIKYKYWKYGDAEPSTYNYTIPASEITISNDTFAVSDYDIGSTIETDTNYFNPEYAYRIKVYVEDNFTNFESNELQIQVGEAVWTEYKNRVDFKRLTIGGYDVLDKGVTNGVYYEKRSDGVAICYGSVNITTSNSRSAGGFTYYSNETYIDLPVTFINTNQVLGISNVALANMNVFCQSYVSVESTSRIRVSFTSTNNNETRSVKYIVIGNWK